MLIRVCNGGRGVNKRSKAGDPEGNKRQESKRVSDIRKEGSHRLMFQSPMCRSPKDPAETCTNRKEKPRERDSFLQRQIVREMTQ